jgi:flagellin-specific chaperone FliS
MTLPYTLGSSNQQNRAANSYKTTAIQSGSEREVMAALIAKIISDIYRARDAYVAGTLDAMCDITDKTCFALDVIRQDLLSDEVLRNPEAAPTAKFLYKTYGTVWRRLTSVLRAKNPAEEFDAIADLLKPVYKAWLPPSPEAAAEQK